MVSPDLKKKKKASGSQGVPVSTSGVGCEHRCSISFPSLRFLLLALDLSFSRPPKLCDSNSQDAAGGPPC